MCANEFEGKHVLMILLQTLPHKILQRIILKSDYAIKRLGGLTRMEKVLQQLWICKILVRQNLHKDRTFGMKRLNKKKFITRKTTKINKLQTEPDAKK